MKELLYAGEPGGPVRDREKAGVGVAVGPREAPLQPAGGGGLPGSGLPKRVRLAQHLQGGLHQRQVAHRGVAPAILGAVVRREHRNSLNAGQRVLGEWGVFCPGTKPTPLSSTPFPASACKNGRRCTNATEKVG